jgi:membrane fusion protein
MGTDAHLMRQDATDKARVATLFRESAMRSAAYRLFGSVTVIVPPSGALALTVALLAMLVLGFVAWYVEIPQRARAIGVLMPPDGLLDVVASVSGRVGNISVNEGQAIDAGELLLDISSGQEQLANLQLQSLQAEITLLDQAHARQVAIDNSRLLALDERLGSINKRLAVAKREYELQQGQVALFERRLTRREGLVSNGNLSVDALDHERASLLQARSRHAAAGHSMLEYEQDVAAMMRARSEAVNEAERENILHDLERRRLQRQVDEYQHLISQEIRATEDGVVARINVRPGAAVAAGEILVKVYKPQRGLEAWLYLPSAKAGFLQAGQVVQLRLQAYPHQLFGTSSAVVTSVSSVAIVPAEVRVPLALTGPVFEVRARLEAAHIKAFNAIWPLAPGTSFQADLVQRRYRLYEWLVRVIAGGSGDRRA